MRFSSPVRTHTAHRMLSPVLSHPSEKPDVFDSDFNESEDESSDDDAEESALRK